MNTASIVSDHYEQNDLIARLTAALTAAGMTGRRLSVEDLAPLDQFHFRGLSATSELADKLPIHADIIVVDLGSGLGGPARYLASRFGCKVHGIDLTPSFVEAAKFLTDLCGLQQRVSFSCANALDLPFTDHSVDLVWTQHVAMNISDREGLYREVFRVLKPGGTLAIYDVVAGPNGPVHFPVPWACEPAASFLLSPEATLRTLLAEGFRTTSWTDKTAVALSWLDARTANSGAPPTLGLHIVNGSAFDASAANLGRNLREGRAALLEAVLQKPGS